MRARNLFYCHHVSLPPYLPSSLLPSYQLLKHLLARHSIVTLRLEQAQDLAEHRGAGVEEGLREGGGEGGKEGRLGEVLCVRSKTR